MSCGSPSVDDSCPGSSLGSSGFGALGWVGVNCVFGGGSGFVFSAGDWGVVVGGGESLSTVVAPPECETERQGVTKISPHFFLIFFHMSQILHRA